MTQDLLVLSTAASIAIVHTLAGPDHYLPFIAMAKARRWPWLKTVWVTAGCGLGHAMGSLVLGLVGVAAGFSLERLADIDGWRGDWAAWGLIAVGLLYAAWGLKRAARTDRHSHLHVHADGTVHAHPHSHRGGHAHVHGAPGRSGLVPWSLFLIFILGPCEPMIPIIIYPAAKGDMAGVAAVAALYTLTTIATMLVVVLAGLWGAGLVAARPWTRFGHAFAGATVALCGAGMVFLGL